jgi:hypothetical protein
LLFSGIRWPAAKVVARTKVVGITVPAAGARRGRLPPKEVTVDDTLIIETTGQGRPYAVHVAEGWWRDFAELALFDEKRVLSFLQRRGDPFGALAPDGTQIRTSDWRGLKKTLSCALVAWDPQPGETGVSHFRPQYRGNAEHMFDVSGGWASDLAVVYPHSSVTPTLRAKVLAAFLCAAAAASVRAGLDMRRCDYCSSWFTLHYASARFCSASCRAAQFNQRRSPHGFGPQDHDQKGSYPMAKPVEGAGNERPPAGPITKLRKPKGGGRARGKDA